VKKGFVALLIILAIVVLVSPAIVGRMAEKTLSENIEWAARESGEIEVTTESFARGWFSSEGQHRIEMQDGDLLLAAQSLLGPLAVDELPVLVVDTKIDHGLIPVSSMSREKGSLAPGLGSAISRMSIELPDGEIIEVPGTIYSEIGLVGELQSRYELKSGSFEDGRATATWGATNINVKTDPRTGEAAFDGNVGSLSVGDAAELLTLDQLTFEGQQQPTKYGVMVGDVAVELSGLAVAAGGVQTAGVKTLSLNARSELDGDDINALADLSTVLHEIPQFGEVALEVVFNMEGADAAALGRVQQGLEGAGSSQDPMASFGAIEQDLKQLFASGFVFNFKRLDVVLPAGTVSSRLLFEFGEEDPATFDWTSLLLSTSASVDLSIPEAIVEMMVQLEPNIAMAIGGGYLVKRGDAYELEAQLKKGLLTVNGAPIPIPLGGMP
jgi:uncharacterized protein YdgA (DUF945 family)